jgi:hypothetical protein
MLRQLIVIISGYLYNDIFVVLTALVEFVWQIVRACVCVVRKTSNKRVSNV